MPAANAAAGGVPKPRGRAPRDCWWDTGVGAWRRNSDNELHDRRAHRTADRHTAAGRQRGRQRNAAHMRDAYARATRARRNTRANAARCNDTLLTPAFDLETVKPESVGLLGAAQCEHCHAQLFAGELVDGKRGKKRVEVCVSTAYACVFSWYYVERRLIRYQPNATDESARVTRARPTRPGRILLVLVKS